MVNAGARYDAVVVGAGPNGLAAAIVLARAGRSVLVLEAAETVGGGSRTAELTLPGFRHDVCSAIHPLAVASPLFAELPLGDHGLVWIDPPAALAHPLDDGTAALLLESVDATAETLKVDAQAYRRLMRPLVADARTIIQEIQGPLRLSPLRHPLAMARYGLQALLPASLFARRRFRGTHARALFAGMAAHSMLRLEQPISAAFGLTLAMSAHAVGWPIARGGSRRIVDALAAHLRELGGAIVTGCRVNALSELAPCAAVLFDLTPRQVVAIAGDALPSRYRRKLEAYRYGPGVFKVDYALDGPIPWRAQECLRAGTVHLGGTLPEIAASERAVARGRVPERPFVLVAQQSLFDTTRAPKGKHTVWAYCHVPHGSGADMTEAITAQVERFAPGFRDRVMATHTMTAVELEQYNANYVGGDINGGIQDLGQLFTRPTLRLNPYTTPNPRLFICSSATPPGGGVHGMCGYWAARAALSTVLR